MLLNLILFKAADSSRSIYEVAMQLLQVCKQMLIKIYFYSGLNEAQQSVLALESMLMFIFIFNSDVWYDS